ncbi:MAG: hypothetical protein HY791_23910 [Deltaproteobacteria bacterium]|nr:hypothetical protein [Deltaproteobacteria bacterium]
MTMNSTETQRPSLDELIAARGSASLAELGLTGKQAIELAGTRPDLEPIYLVRFRSRQDKVRVEEIRGYAWPSQKIALDHLGYKAEDAQLLRLESRQPVPFPARLYASFSKDPKQLEELRSVEKAYLKAMKQAPSKPGRAERDVIPLQVAFKKLGAEVAFEMWVDAASTFQRYDNATYASKMLGNLLKLVEKDKNIDVSALARTVLAAADDGVFNTKLYEFTWDTVQKKHSVETALGFGFRVFRRLMESGRPLPGDFIKDLRNAAVKGKVTGFDALYESNVLFASGLASFWNTAKKSASWRDAATADHGETSLLRRKLSELWTRSQASADGEVWRTNVWERIARLNPELTPYGRVVLTETIVDMASSARPEAERILGATLSMLSRKPRSADRERLELAADRALSRVAEIDRDVLWDRSASLEEALRTATGDLSSFVVLYDLLSDVADAIGPRQINGQTTSVVRSLPGLEAAWVGALVACLSRSEGVTEADDGDGDDGDSYRAPIVPLLGEALSLLSPDTAAEQLAELAPLIGLRLARDLQSGSGLEAWERVLATLRSLGPVGVGATTIATEKFIERAAEDAEFANAARLAHQLDQGKLREAAECRQVVDETIRAAAGNIYLDPVVEKLLRPESELGDAIDLLSVERTPTGAYSLLWAKSPKDRWSDDPVKEIALTEVSADGKTQRVVASGNVKGASKATQWVTSMGLRIVTLKDRTVTMFDTDLTKPVAKGVFGEEGGYAWNSGLQPSLRTMVVSVSGESYLVDESLSVIQELDDASSSVLEGPPGSFPVIVHANWRGIESIHLGPDKKTAPLKLPDFDSPSFGLRTDQGWAIAYQAKKTHLQRWARYDEATSSWSASDAASEGTPIDFTSYGRTVLPADGWETVGFVENGGDAEVMGFDGKKLALAGAGGEDVLRIDLRTGVMITNSEIRIERSIPARIAAAKLLLASIGATPGAPLPRELYGDQTKLEQHLFDAIAARESGKAAFETLGPHARPLISETVKCITMPLVESRSRVLKAMESEAPAVRSVPRHAEGVRRTSVRRAVREGFEAPLEGLLFWALDGNDPGPVVDHLLPEGLPVSQAAFGVAVRLLSLAQNSKTDGALASRVLALAESVVSGLSQPGRLFELPAREWSLDKSDVDDDWSASSESLSFPRAIEGRGSGHLLWYPGGAYAKKELPFPWKEDADERRVALSKWVERELFGPMDPRRVSLSMDAGKAKVFEIESSIGDRKITSKVLTHHRADGLDWRLVDLGGVATLNEWHEVFGRFERGAESTRVSDETPATLWPAVGVVRREDLAALASGIKLTRDHLDRREALHWDAWPAPVIKGVEDARHARLVLLSWLLNDIDASNVGSTSSVFEKIRKATKLVTGYSSRLQPQKDGQSGTDIRRSANFAKVCLTGVIKTGGWRDVDMVLLRHPQELVDAFHEEAGPAPKGGRER